MKRRIREFLLLIGLAALLAGCAEENNVTKTPVPPAPPAQPHLVP